MWPERDFFDYNKNIIIRISQQELEFGRHRINLFLRCGRRWIRHVPVICRASNGRNYKMQMSLDICCLTSLKFHSSPWGWWPDVRPQIIPSLEILYFLACVLWSVACPFLLTQTNQPSSSRVSGCRSHFSKVQRSSFRNCFLGMLIIYNCVICFHHSFG